MNGSESTSGSPRRVKLTDISSRAWEHPADRAALRSLNAIPGFSDVVRKIVGLFGERGLRLFFQAQAVRVTPRQYGWVHDLHLQAIDTLDLGWEPELYISQTPVVNAGALGVDEPFVLINGGAVDLLNREELETVLAHEIGHIASDHVLYRTVFTLLLMLAQRQLPIAGIAIGAVILAMAEWNRKSELSCDRAALLGTQNPDAVMSAFMKLAGGTEHHSEALDLNEFIGQSDEYAEDVTLGDAVFKVMNLLGSTHPFHVLRVGELRRWIREGHYDRIVRGEYQRRSEDARAYSEDAREAATYYGNAVRKGIAKLSRFLDEAIKGGPVEL
ncbi:MAG: M48 family metallopeptidase [Gemmatimonadetes bacterium]|uniref:M48 family metallopeptidase n=1 Tax=Candidatus Kutchimonas denitrificans TaxID=3056748 RepID=A0AAE4ZAZ4_9BACT|nr:M48 family metallopeptidase [Gemmatimonadota bacterium]NIR74110.1 M48 family metallopeptidase [Candidatus Kutchimonas denitrificans]NIS01292.1 M48 family metallopeptidase [Gemmatimonadota bacterium]NIT67023.1 M48 family metallopeptidase [Gemmatimonadota bacterium]NIU51683.1 M48 family metalloprotease [Gemmatimonadota bacterium]